MLHAQPVVMAGGSAPLQKAISLVLHEASRFQIIARYDDVASLARQAAILPHPALFLLIGDAGCDTETNARQLRSAFPGTPLLVIGDMTDPRHIAAITLQADGYVHHNEYEQLPALLDELLQKGMVTNHWMCQSRAFWQSVRHNPTDAAAAEKLYTLSPTERMVARTLREQGGVPFKFIAASLGMNKNTLAQHIRNVYSKLGLHSKSEVAIFLERCGDAL